jgi:hypothetical protein
MKYLLAIVLFVLLCGCASQPISLADSKEVPPDRILSVPAKLATSVLDGGHVIVVRDPISGGKGPQLRLSIDGQAVADLEPTERYEVFLQEGEYILSILPIPNRLSQFTSTETAVTIKKGQQYRFRAGYAPYSFFLQRTAL